MRRLTFLLGIALSAFIISSCGDDEGIGDDTDIEPNTPPDYTARGPSAVGVSTTSLTDTSRGRTLPIEVWYPAQTAGSTSSVLDFETGADRRDVLSSLLESAPAECVATTTGATRDEAPTTGDHPVILYSHCYTCTRWSAHAVMERLASHGFVVVAPDHTGDTLFERETGDAPDLDAGLLALRVADIHFVLDRILGGEGLPEGVAPDPSKVGMLGHSLGSITAGAVAQDDDRIAAVLGMAAPMQNPLVEGVSLEQITVPLGLLVATEDHSVGQAGNILLRNNFDDANTPAYKIEIVDAGHWSVTNIAGITDAFVPGCGDDLRQVTEEPFTYISVERANGLTAGFVTAFFAAHLDGEETALTFLRSDPWPVEAPLAVRE